MRGVQRRAAPLCRANLRVDTNSSASTWQLRRTELSSRKLQFRELKSLERVIRQERRKNKSKETIEATNAVSSNRMFFGPEKETEEIIQVHCEAFVKMMQYIYGRHPHLVLNKITDSKVYMELFNLNQKYELNNRKTILDSLQKFKISRENMIYSATIANSYRGLFPEESNELLLKCLKFYLDKSDKEDLPNYETSQDTLQKLMEVGRSTLQPFGQLSGDRNIFFFRSAGTYPANLFSHS